MSKALIGTVMHLECLSVGAEPTAVVIAGKGLLAERLPCGTAEMGGIKVHTGP